MTLLLRNESVGETSEPEMDPVSCISKGALPYYRDQTEISQRQADVIKDVLACPKSDFHSVRFISSTK